MKIFYFSVYKDGKFVIRGKAIRLRSSSKYCISIFSSGRYTSLVRSSLDDFISVAISDGYYISLYPSEHDSLR